VSRESPTTPAKTAGYEADPEGVRRVLLLYSGGLDTSVMLKWIQDRYDAEVICLTVNLGQPGEDYELIEGKALRLGALACHVVDAREEFAREYVARAIKANALYGGGYPLFTALGRPLIAKLAVEHALREGCDTIAHGCTGKGNDQVRIETTIATLAPQLGVIDRVRARARDPRQGRHRGGALLDRRQPVGALLGGTLDRGPRARPRGGRVPAGHAARGRA
jgi:argininosuccinate synthase